MFVSRSGRFGARGWRPFFLNDSGFLGAYYCLGSGNLEIPGWLCTGLDGVGRFMGLLGVATGSSVLIGPTWHIS